ncbi:hypothetical protein J1605_015405 [Eschrichtius robustus]|uniref:Centrosomal protein of 290kDa coiled-coil region domain-containing protein n=1 Tax=Eschrichtius robustus TaxID=9764 RepID=A0AB34GC04_ESCRO|nr:hypothetical protein J1605_015405 [Eschrichtius robustus]
MAQHSAGGRDTRFLRDEIRQLEKQLEQKDKELEDMEKELEKEKKVNEQLALRNEEAENENSKLRRENEQLRQDIIDYQKQIDSQKETLLSRRGEDSDYRSQLSKKNYELVQYLDEIQVQELTNLLKAKNEEDDPIMAAVNAKVEEWKLILSSKDDEIIEYQQMLHNLREKLKNAQLDADKSNIMALQQGIQERDSQIKMLTDQVEQYTKEMEKNTFIIEDLKNELQRNKGASALSQQTHYMKIQSKIQILEDRTKEAERTAELAEADAREKDKELVETLKRLKDYESGVYGLEDAVIEIKNCKNQIKIRDREIEVLTKEINKLELKINDFLDENEALKERMGLTVEDLNLNENFSQENKMGEKKLDFMSLKNMSEAQSRVNSKIDHLEKETSLLRQSEGSNVVFKGVDLPDGIAPSSANIINSQNEYLIHILQELEYKENKLKNLEDSLEDYNRKFAVIRHQQSLLYKEYLSEKEAWKTECETMKEEKRKLEDQIQQDAIKIKEYNLTKINLEAQKVEQMLRDELADSVSKTVSDADRQHILELEKSEMELKVEVSKLKEISDIAKRQVEILNTQQQSREKEVESIRMQLLDYQAQSDEKALIAKLHQHLVSLQVSEATALGKLESVTSKLQKMEAHNLRLEQKLDEKEQALYSARLEGRNRATHLRQTIQSLRRQFSGALPLAQQETFSKTMIQLQNDKLKIMQEMKNSQQEHRNMKNKTLEMELKLKGLEELISTLKDARGAQKFHEERQMAWDQREVELERQLDVFDRQQNEILNAAQKDLIKQSPTPVPTNKHFIHLAEMEQRVAEQDDSLSSLVIKLKKVSQDLERQKEVTELKVKEFENIKLRLQENHADEVKQIKAQVEDLRCLLAQSQKESQSLKSELQAQKEANSRAPTTTMRNLVERLKSQLALKEKQQKALSRALLELRAEMTAAAEERIISMTSQKEANLNVQQIVDQHTKELKGKALIDNKQSLIEELQKKIKKLESQLEKKVDEVEIKPTKEKVPRNILQCYSNEEKHKAQDIVDPTELNKSESRPNSKSSPFRSTNGTLTDFNSNFEKEPDRKVGKINQDCCENNKQEYKNKEENELGKNEKEKGHIAEDVSHNNHTDPEESAGEDCGYTTSTAAVRQCAEEEAQANSETDVSVQPRNEASQV